jgi:hypothetical protein
MQLFALSSVFKDCTPPKGGQDPTVSVSKPWASLGGTGQVRPRPRNQRIVIVGGCRLHSYRAVRSENGRNARPKGPERTERKRS